MPDQSESRQIFIIYGFSCAVFKKSKEPEAKSQAPGAKHPLHFLIEYFYFTGISPCCQFLCKRP